MTLAVLLVALIGFVEPMVAHHARGATFIHTTDAEARMSACGEAIPVSDAPPQVQTLAVRSDVLVSLRGHHVVFDLGLYSQDNRSSYGSVAHLDRHTIAREIERVPFGLVHVQCAAYDAHIPRWRRAKVLYAHHSFWFLSWGRRKPGDRIFIGKHEVRAQVMTCGLLGDKYGRLCRTGGDGSRACCPSSRPEGRHEEQHFYARQDYLLLGKCKEVFRGLSHSPLLTQIGVGALAIAAWAIGFVGLGACIGAIWDGRKRWLGAAMVALCLGCLGVVLVTVNGVVNCKHEQQRYRYSSYQS